MNFVVCDTLKGGPQSQNLFVNNKKTSIVFLTVFIFALMEKKTIVSVLFVFMEF